MDSFYTQIYTLVARIPPGCVASYGQLARLLGRPGCARQVGWAVSRCPEALPWQRVVRGDGSITGGLHPELRQALLQQEGVVFLPDGRVDMARCRWQPE